MNTHFIVIGKVISDFQQRNNHYFVIVETPYTSKDGSTNYAKIPCVIFNNNYKVNALKSIKSKIVSISGYISSIENDSIYPSVSLIVSDLNVFEDNKSIDKALEQNEIIDDDSLPF